MWESIDAQLFRKDLLRTILANLKTAEQNLLRSTIEAYSNRHGPQSSSNTIPYTESKDCETNAGRAGGGIREGERE
jgi:hypothetical protein